MVKSDSYLSELRSSENQGMLFASILDVWVRHDFLAAFFLCALRFVGELDSLIFLLVGKVLTGNCFNFLISRFVKWG